MSSSICGIYCRDQVYICVHEMLKCAHEQHENECCLLGHTHTHDTHRTPHTQILIEYIYRFVRIEIVLLYRADTGVHWRIIEWGILYTICIYINSQNGPRGVIVFVSISVTETGIEFKIIFGAMTMSIAGWVSSASVGNEHRGNLWQMLVRFFIYTCNHNANMLFPQLNIVFAVQGCGLVLLKFFPHFFFRLHNFTASNR